MAKGRELIDLNIWQLIIQVELFIVLNSWWLYSQRVFGAADSASGLPGF